MHYDQDMPIYNQAMDTVDQLKAALAEKDELLRHRDEGMQASIDSLCNIHAKAIAEKDKTILHYEVNVCPELERQIATLAAENERLKKVPMKYRRMEYNAQLQARVKELEEANSQLAGATEKPPYKRDLIEALEDVIANHTLNGVVATMYCQGCIDDFDVAKAALKGAEEPFSTNIGDCGYVAECRKVMELTAENADLKKRIQGMLDAGRE